MKLLWALNSPLSEMVYRASSGAHRGFLPCSWSEDLCFMPSCGCHIYAKKSKTNELQSNFSSLCVLQKSWFKKMYLSLSLPFIHWFAIAERKYYTKSDIATAQWHNGLTRCASFPLEDWILLHLKAFNGLLPFIFLHLQKGRKTELLKISSGLRPKHHFKA